MDPPGRARREGRLHLEGQGLHALGLLVLLSGVAAGAAWWEGVDEGALLGLGARGWLGVAVATAVAHQVYVAVCWRLELWGGALSRTLGARAFPLYAAGFAVLGLSRVVAVTLLAVANAGSVAGPAPLFLALAVFVAVPAGWLFHSVHRHFGFRRALGIDHFDPAYRSAPLVREGIFRFTPNAMYVFGFLLLWVPGLALQSAGALLAAAFHHAYIWVHYGATERPDMRRIHG
jgi:hypothetical protein